MLIINADSAFFNNNLHNGEDTYFKWPPVYVAKCKKDLIWLFIQALYGLKQVGHLWYKNQKTS